MDNPFHTPVLLREVVEGLKVQKGKKYIDATLGGGGDAVEILKRGGIVLGLDADQEALDEVKRKFQISNFKFQIGKELVLVKGNFRNIGEIAGRYGFVEVSGILFDLGVSLHQLKRPERGFSFQEDVPLNMRMDNSSPDGRWGQVKAADLVNGLYEHELIKIFEKYGEEHMARAIAHAICSARAIKPIQTTGELVAIVERVKHRAGKLNPATKVFQALRIAVNDELRSLEEALPQAVELLKPGGRLCVISFHSLEDRIVKHFFGKMTVTKKPIIPKQEEILKNPRARSAKLRIYEKG